MVHDDYKEMIPARALSALEVADDRVLNEHLSTCAECRRELQQWEGTAAALALAAPSSEPSPQLRDRILLEIRTPIPRTDSTDKGSGGGAKVIPFTPPAKDILSYVGSFGAIAAVLLFIALLASVVVLWQQNRSAQTQVTALSLQIRSTQEQLAHNQELLAFFTAPGKTMIDLAPRNASGAHAIMAYDSSGRAVLVANGLAQVPEGKAYQLWYIVGSKPLAGKVFVPDDKGKATLEEQLPSAARVRTVFAITLEPAGGSQAPTSAVLLQSGS